MNKLRKIAFVFVLLEIAFLVIGNIYAKKAYEEVNKKEHKIEINRIKSQMESGTDCSDIDLGNYKYVTNVSLFAANERCDNEYAVCQVGDDLYRFEYEQSGITKVFVIMDSIIVLIILLTLGVFIYLEYKILRPFSRMNGIATELSKGNLTVPIKQEKSKYFKDFLWGLDMLRDKLEGDKQRELELLKEKKLMVLSLSHDIKTPLSASDLYIKALLKGLYKTKEEQDNALRGIEKNLIEIKEYVSEIANASRDDILTMEVQNSEYYLQDLINEIEKYYKDKCKQLHIEFKIENMENCMLSGDFERTIEVMQNAMENAIKYGDGKSISIDSYEEEECKLISITNSGCHLKKEELTNIFDSFYRGSNTENIEGSGLGLYICRELMKQMDGNIFAKVQDDTFVLTLVIRKV